VDRQVYFAASVQFVAITPFAASIVSPGVIRERTSVWVS
jgi:hypothetical protein